MKYRNNRKDNSRVCLVCDYICPAKILAAYEDLVFVCLLACQNFGCRWNLANSPNNPFTNLAKNFGHPRAKKFLTDILASQ